MGEFLFSLRKFSTGILKKWWLWIWTIALDPLDLFNKYIRTWEWVQDIPGAPRDKVDMPSEWFAPLTIAFLFLAGGWTYHQLRVKPRQNGDQQVVKEEHIAARLFSISSHGSPEFSAPGERGFPQHGGPLWLRLSVLMDARPEMRVETIQVDLSGRRLEADWAPHDVWGDMMESVYFEVPEWVKQGKRTATLVAWSEARELKPSTPFEIDFPKQ